MRKAILLLSLIGLPFVSIGQTVTNYGTMLVYTKTRDNNMMLADTYGGRISVIFDSNGTHNIIIRYNEGEQLKLYVYDETESLIYFIFANGEEGTAKKEPTSFTVFTDEIALVFQK